MCKLVPFKTQPGEIVMVADVKVDKLNKYLEMFPRLSSIDKLQYGYDMSITLLDEFPDSCYDDTLGISIHRDLSSSVGAIREALNKGVVLYDRQN